jgi:hypothetical protein
VEGARRAAAGFAGARLLTVVGDGDHGTYAIRGNRCVDDIAEAYLVEGVVPADGASCPGLSIPAPVPVAGDASDPADRLGTVLDVLTRLVEVVGPLPL